MGMEALAEPLTLKISSKRQITIPAKVYEGAGFKEYALCTWTDKGMLLQPLDNDDEDVTVDILRYLIDEGYDGEELISQYQEMKKKIIPLKARLDQAERDIVEGRVGSPYKMLDELRDKYDL